MSTLRKRESGKRVASKFDFLGWMNIGWMRWMQQGRFYMVMSGIAAFVLLFMLAGCGETVAPKLDNPYDPESSSYERFPELSTLVVTQVSTTEAQSGGSFDTDYGSDVQSKGVCWAEQGASSGLPVVGGNCTDEGGGFDAFVSVMTGLAPGGAYVVRSYATNSDGTVYGGERSFVKLAVYMLTVAVDGDGSVTPESGEYEEGAEVELTAQALDGWRFVEWTGDVSDGSGGVGSTENPLVVTMDRDKSVTAEFEQIPVYTLTTSVEGSGTVSPPSGEYEGGTEIEVTAQASGGWRFVEWTGDVSGDTSIDNPLVLIMDGDKSVTAVFELDPNFGRDTETEIVEVVNPETGVTWMDRNLGASRVATSLTDSEAYGDLYQWGRLADGHEKRNSATRSMFSSSDQPGHSDFILSPNSPFDWRSTQNDNLWQEPDGLNNPCPVGYRLPTVAEWNVERQSWDSNNSVGAYGSPVKLPVAGYRYNDVGSLDLVGSDGFYWSSSVAGTFASYLYFGSNGADVDSYGRAYGASVRCLKE